MKKFLVLFAITLLFAVSSNAQRVVMANYTDTITDSQTKYYPASVVPELTYGNFQIYVDHISGSSDSTYVAIQGSSDNSTWVTLGSSVYGNIVALTAAAPTTFSTVRFSTSDAGFIWTIAAHLSLPYYRYAVTHYATGTIRVKGWLYKKK